MTWTILAYTHRIGIPCSYVFRFVIVSHPTSGLTAVGGNWTPMLSLQLPVSFLSPGRFFPPQHMVGPTVLTYLLSHRISTPVTLSSSPAPFLLYLLFSFNFWIWIQTAAAHPGERRGGGPTAAWWGGTAGRRRRWRRGAEAAQQADGAEEALPRTAAGLFFSSFFNLNKTFSISIFLM